MRRKLLIKPQARKDIAAIVEYIAADNVDAAQKVGAQIEDSIRGIFDTPNKGHSRPDVQNPAYRFWRIYSYLIAYRYDEQTLTIVRVILGRRDIGSVFRR